MKTKIFAALFSISLLLAGCDNCYLCDQDAMWVFFENGNDSVTVLVLGKYSNSIECYYLRELGYTQYDVMFLNTSPYVVCDKEMVEYNESIEYKCVADN